MSKLVMVSKTGIKNLIEMELKDMIFALKECGAKKSSIKVVGLFKKSILSSIKNLGD